MLSRAGESAPNFADISREYPWPKKNRTAVKDIYVAPEKPKDEYSQARQWVCAVSPPPDPLHARGDRWSGPERFRKVWVPALSTTHPLVLAFLLTNELLNSWKTSSFNLEWN